MSKALTKSVIDAWDHIPYAKLTNIFSCIPIVLQLIAEDNGGNNYVESR